MAVPTLSTLSPTGGAPTGGQMLEIVGTDFRLPTAPAGGVIPVPVAPPSVRVTIGGTEAVVHVLSASRLFVRAPKRAMPISGELTLAVEAVDVVIENIDDNGVLIAGETVTAAAAYTYTRPSIGAETPSTLLRLTIAVVDLLRSEVHANTVIETSSDYDPDTGTSRIEVETTPQIVLAGPNIEFNSFFTFRGPYSTPGINAGESFSRRRHRVVDATFSVMGITNSTVQLINLMDLFESVIDRNVDLMFDCDPDNPGTELIPLELSLTRSPDYDRVDGHMQSNLRVFRASLLVQGLPITAISGVEQDNILTPAFEVDTATLDTPLQIGENLPATQGAPWRSPPDTGYSVVQRPQGGPTRSPPESDVSSPKTTPQGSPTRSPPDEGSSE